VTSSEVEELLCGLILDGKILGKLDQVEKILELENAYMIILKLDLPIMNVLLPCFRGLIKHSNYAIL
jgi:hypothetical protein